MASSPTDRAKQRLRTLVEELGGIHTVAEEIGYTSDAVRAWIHRRSGPSFQALVRLRRLGVDVNWLLDGQRSARKPTTQRVGRTTLQ